MSGMQSLSHWDRLLLQMEWRKEFMTLAMKIMEAEEKANLKLLISLVKKGKLTEKEAAEEAKMTEDEFLTAMEEFGD